MGLPVSLAYATLAGLPPEKGIYCYMLGGLAYALMGTCRQLAIGPTSAIAMLVGTTIAPMALGSESRFAAIAALTAGVAGIFCLLAWALRLSSLVNFISDTILVGFKAGAALTIGLSQLPKLFGVPGGGDHFFSRSLILIQQIPQTNMTVLAMGLAAIVIMLAGERLLPGRPVAVLVVALSIAAMIWFPLRDMGVQSVSAIPSSLPSFQPPSLRAKDVDGVLELGFACFLLAYIEGISAAKTIARRHGQKVDPRQELLALGTANLFLAVGQGFPVAGGFSQSAVNDGAGAKTPMSLVITSTTLTVFVLYFADVLKDLPNLVLAAIVLVAVRGLVNVKEMKRLWKLSRPEFWIAMAAFSGVLMLGILRGVLLAAFCSLIVLLAGASRPNVAALGRMPATRRYSELGRHPEAQEIPGVFVFRVDVSVLYFNAEHIRESVKRAAAARQAKVAVCDLSSTPNMDISGATMLHELNEDLQREGGCLKLAEVRTRIRVLLREAGFGELLPHEDYQQTVDDVVQSELARVGVSRA